MEENEIDSWVETIWEARVSETEEEIDEGYGSDKGDYYADKEIL